MTFDPKLAEIRFGTGLSPVRAAPASTAEMLRRLQGPDVMAARHPIPRFETLIPALTEFFEQSRLLRQKRGSEEAKAAQKRIRALRKAGRENQQLYLNATLRRAAGTEDGLRERLTRFWADHFTVKGKQGILIFSAATYVEEAIRPHLTGSFAALLKSAVTHPMMLAYLDQVNSAGPTSAKVKKQGGGLNENLAREVMELHTLGVGADYSQADVRQLAELFTGLSYDPRKGFLFRPFFAEPGAETVLGQEYGGGQPALADVHAVLDDLARHPATARHIATKLATHFVADTPEPALIDHIAAAFHDSGGDLMATYGALLDPPAAWDPRLSKARQPFDFVAATLRALDMPGKQIEALGPKDTGLYLALPMQVMGQSWEAPVGPDGWPEAEADWITPQGMAGRIQWAMMVPGLLRPELPDPRAFVDTALGGTASDTLRFAASAAETRAVGIGLVLISPEFQRR